MLTALTEVTCPHCWETVELVLDLSVERQTYVEDCQVCCHPMQVTCLAEHGELLEVRVEAAN